MGEEDVSWSGEGVGDQVGHFSGWGQGSGLGSREEDVTDGIVAHDPVSIASTANLVVPKRVRCATAFWAGVGGIVQWNSQPAALQQLVHAASTHARYACVIAQTAGYAKLRTLCESLGSGSERGLEKMSKHCRYVFLVVVFVCSVLYLYYPRELRLRIAIDRTDPRDGAILAFEDTTSAPAASRKPTGQADHDGRRSDATSPTLADSLPPTAQSHATAADKSQTESPSQSEATTASVAVTTQQDSTEGSDSTTESIHASTLTRLGSDLSIDLSSCPSGSIMLQPDWRERKPRHNNCPTLFIVGVRKGGTTSLYHYMDKHLDFKCLRMSNGPKDGETFYFSKGYNKYSWEEYIASFPKGIMSGESSVDNIVYCKAPNRLFESCGMQAKVVLLLRHPIDRLMSNFLMRARLGTRLTNMKTRITDKVNSELEIFSERIAPKIHSNAENFTISPNDWAKILCVFNPATNLVNEGMYYAFVQNYLCNFPAENILFVNSEEFFTNSSRVLNQIFKFLGLEELDEKTLKGITSEVFNRRNQEILPHQVLSAADREKLNRIYQPFNAALFNLLGWDNVKWD